MHFDPTITLGNLLSIITLIIGIASFYTKHATAFALLEQSNTLLGASLDELRKLVNDKAAILMEMRTELAVIKAEHIAYTKNNGPKF